MIQKKFCKRIRYTEIINHIYSANSLNIGKQSFKNSIFHILSSWNMDAFNILFLCVANWKAFLYFTQYVLLILYYSFYAIRGRKIVENIKNKQFFCTTPEILTIFEQIYLLESSPLWFNKKSPDVFFDFFSAFKIMIYFHYVIKLYFAKVIAHTCKNNLDMGRLHSFLHSK